MDIKADLSNINELLEDYQNKLDFSKDDLNIKGKTLLDANKEQPAHLAYYDELKVQLKFILSYVDIKVKELYGNCFKQLSNQATQLYSDRAKDKIIEANPEYVKLMKIYIRVEHVYNTAAGIVEQYRARGFILNNIVKIKTASLEDITL